MCIFDRFRMSRTNTAWAAQNPLVTLNLSDVKIDMVSPPPASVATKQPKVRDDALVRGFEFILK